MHERVRRHCWQASATDEIAGHSDLIVGQEVLPHLTETAGRQAISNFCAHAERVLFSSGPYPPNQRHLNDLGPAAWAGMFTQAGFHPDASVNASFMTPWVAPYRRTR